MKKALLTLSALALLASPALAAHVLDEDGNPISSGHDNGNPMQIGQVWGLDGFSTPKLSKGQSGCQDSFGCFDISGTSFWQNSMIETARQLVKNGLLRLFPQFNYWAQFVR